MAIYRVSVVILPFSWFVYCALGIIYSMYIGGTSNYPLRSCTCVCSVEINIEGVMTCSVFTQSVHAVTIIWVLFR